jgi:transcriptional regulator with XRE-family HTH domain
MKKESRKKVRISELNFENIGDRITFIRLMQGQNIEEFSSVLGISKGNLSDLENNKNKPSYDVLVCISENFNINSEWIISGKGKLFKRLYSIDDKVIPDMEMIQLAISGFFNQKELAADIIVNASEIEKISPNSLAEVSDYLSIKLKSLLKFGERRIWNRRRDYQADKVPDGMDRRSGKDRRSHELLRL